MLLLNFCSNLFLLHLLLAFCTTWQVAACLGQVPFASKSAAWQTAQAMCTIQIYIVRAAGK